MFVFSFLDDNFSKCQWFFTILDICIAFVEICLRGYKTFFMLNSAEHKVYPPNKSQITYNCKFFLAKHS